MKRILVSYFFLLCLLSLTHSAYAGAPLTTTLAAPTQLSQLRQDWQTQTQSVVDQTDAVNATSAVSEKELSVPLTDSQSVERRRYVLAHVLMLLSFVTVMLVALALYHWTVIGLPVFVLPPLMWVVAYLLFMDHQAPVKNSMTPWQSHLYQSRLTHSDLVNLDPSFQRSVVVADQEISLQSLLQKADPQRVFEVVELYFGNQQRMVYALKTNYERTMMFLTKALAVKGMDHEGLNQWLYLKRWLPFLFEGYHGKVDRNQLIWDVFLQSIVEGQGLLKGEQLAEAIMVHYHWDDYRVPKAMQSFFRDLLILSIETAQKHSDIVAAKLQALNPDDYGSLALLGQKLKSNIVSGDNYAKLLDFLLQEMTARIASNKYRWGHVNEAFVVKMWDKHGANFANESLGAKPSLNVRSVESIIKTTSMKITRQADQANVVTLSQNNRSLDRVDQVVLQQIQNVVNRHDMDWMFVSSRQAVAVDIQWIKNLSEEQPSLRQNDLGTWILSLPGELLDSCLTHPDSVRDAIEYHISTNNNMDHMA